MLSLHFPSSQVQLNLPIPDSSTSSTITKQCRAMRKWEVGSVHSSSFLLLLGPRTFPLLHQDLIPRLQENFCSSNWSMSSPTYFVAVDICMAVSHMYFSCLSHSCCTAFLSFLCHGDTANITDGLNFGHWWAHFGVNWKWLSSTWRQLLIFFHKGHTRSLFLYRHMNQIQLFQQLNDPEIYFEKLKVWISIVLVF